MIALKNVMARVSLAFTDFSMRTKMLICFIILITVLILSIGFIANNKSSEVIDRQSIDYSQLVLNQLVDRVEKLKEDTRNILINLIIKPEFQNGRFETLDDYEYINKISTIISEFNTIASLKKEISSIYMFVEPERIISPFPSNSKDELAFKEYMVYRSSIEKNEMPVWTGVHLNEFKLDSEKYVLTLSRQLFDSVDNRAFGALIINIPARFLWNIYELGTGAKSYNFLIIDKNGNSIFNGSGSTGEESIQRAYLPEILKSEKPSGALNFKDKSMSYFVRYQVSPDREWFYVTEIPMNYIQENSFQVKRFTFIILIIGLILSSLAVLIISSYFTTPLRKMVRVMKAVENGNFDLKTGIHNRSEIGQMSQRFDHMVDEIKMLITRLEEGHQLKRKEELNFLQAQITPHFLYNSLNTIKCLASIQKAAGIQEITESLIDLLRMSISRKDIYITVEEEIALVRKYLVLQSYKYGNRLEVKYECSEEVMNCLTVKMVLQPLVENALFHGIDVSHIAGRITIRAYKYEDTLRMEIEDNGGGMDPDKIQKILHGENGSQSRFSGIGVKNVAERIRMYFGEASGLSYESEPGSYTCAVITLPIIREIPNEHNGNLSLL